jgi:hypothetical protein
MNTKVDPRQPSGVTAPIYRHSGSMKPDAPAGGQVSRDQYANKEHAPDKDRA